MLQDGREQFNGCGCCDGCEAWPGDGTHLVEGLIPQGLEGVLAMKWYRRVQECTYVRGSDDVIAIITSQTGWLCIFRRGGCAGAVPHDEEGVES